MTQPPPKKNNQLGDTLKELTSAIEDWDRITNKEPVEQDVSRENLEKKTKELLVKLRRQIDDLSQG